jgi:dynein heavy chain 1
MSTRLSKNLVGGQLNEEQLKQIEVLEEHSIFGNLSNEIEQNESEWIEFLQSASPEQFIPKLKSDVKDPIGKQIVNLILMKVFRPDKFNPIAYQIVQSVLGPECRDDYTI